jgi:hypothetical protein
LDRTDKIRVAGYGSFDCGFGISDFGLEKDGLLVTGYRQSAESKAHSVKVDNSEISEKFNAMPYALKIQYLYHYLTIQRINYLTNPGCALTLDGRRHKIF